MARDDKTGPTASSPSAGAGGGATAEPKLPISFREFLLLTALLNSLTAMSIDIMLPSLPSMGAAFGVPTANDQQLIITYYFLGLATGQLFYGPLSDRHGRKPLLLLGLCIYLVAAIAAVTVGEFNHLLWARLLQGFGGAATRVLAVAIVRDLFAGRQMARVMSMVMTVHILVPMFAPALGQGIAALGGWRSVFYFLIAVALVDMAWSWMRLPESRGPRLPADKPTPGSAGSVPTARPSYGAAMRATLANRTTTGYAVASSFVFGCLATYLATAQQVFGDVYQLGNKFPLAFGLIASLIAAANITNTRLVMRLGMRRVSHTALAGFIGLAVLLVLATARGNPPLAVFGPLLALTFFCFGLMMSNFNAIAMQPMGRIAGMAASLTGFYTTAAGATFGWLVARQFDGTVRPLSLGFLVLGLLTACAVVWTEGRGGLFKGE